MDARGQTIANCPNASLADVVAYSINVFNGVHTERSVTIGADRWSGTLTTDDFERLRSALAKIDAALSCGADRA